MVVVGHDFEDETDGRRHELYVVGWSECGIGIVVVGSDLEGQRLCFHIVVGVVDDNPKSVACSLVSNKVGANHGVDQPRGHVGGVKMVDRQYIGEVDVGPFVDFLVELELKLEGVVAFVLSDPDVGESNGVGPETSRVGAAGVDHLVVATETFFHGAGGGAAVSVDAVPVVAFLAGSVQHTVATESRTTATCAAYAVGRVAGLTDGCGVGNAGIAVGDRAGLNDALIVGGVDFITCGAGCASVDAGAFGAVAHN